MSETNCVAKLRELGLACQLFEQQAGFYAGNGGPTKSSQIRDKQGHLTRISTEDLEASLFFRWGIGQPDAELRQQPGSWAYAILPILQKQAEYDMVDVEADLPQYRCPSRNRERSQPTKNDRHGNYQSAGCGWTKTDFSGNSRALRNLPAWLSQSDLRDGTSYTIQLGEKAFDFVVHRPTTWYWDEPIFSGGSKGTARAGLTLCIDGSGVPYKENWGSAHPSVVQFSKFDGSVSSVTRSIDWRLLRRLLHPSDGELSP